MFAGKKVHSFWVGLAVVQFEIIRGIRTYPIKCWKYATGKFFDPLLSSISDVKILMSEIKWFSRFYIILGYGRAGPGAVIKAACLVSRRSHIQTPPWHSSFKETKCFFSAHSQIFNIVGSLHDRDVASSASDRQGANFESCVIYLTILRRFSWPSLAYIMYMCTMVA